MVQSDQLTTNIPNNSPNSTEIGQQDDYDYQDNREEYLYQVDGTVDINTHLLIILQMMMIESQIIMHVKDKERYTLQQIQLEKI